MASPPPYQPGRLFNVARARDGLVVTRPLYGTAWRKANTERLVLRAVRENHFRSIDTGGNPKDFDEKGVGRALKQVIEVDGMFREGLFIQTKVDPLYMSETNLGVPIKKQVELSIASSLSNLLLEYVDCLLLQSPYPEHEQTMEAWRAMEDAVQAGMVLRLGIANIVVIDQLERLDNEAIVKPVFLQQRFWSDVEFQQQVRAFCADREILVQSYWIFRGLDAVWSKMQPSDFMMMQNMTRKYDVTMSNLISRFVMSLGFLPVIGASSDKHLLENLRSWRCTLSAEDAETIHAALTQTMATVEPRPAASYPLSDRAGLDLPGPAKSLLAVLPDYASAVDKSCKTNPALQKMLAEPEQTARIQQLLVGDGSLA